MNKRIELKIRKLCKNILSDVLSKDNIDALLAGKTISIPDDKYEKLFKKLASELAKLGIAEKRTVWKNVYNKVKASGRKLKAKVPNTYRKYELDLMKRLAVENFKQIKTIPAEQLKMFEHKYASSLVSQVIAGSAPRGALLRELKKHGAKNAKMIARTETAKIQTKTTELKSKVLDIVAYTWIASNDRRTRPSHKAMNRVIVFWRDLQTEKPLLDGMFGNAGEFPNCRCDAEPIADIDDVTKAKHKVWDYRNQKVIELTYNETLEALERGSL